MGSLSPSRSCSLCGIWPRSPQEQQHHTSGSPSAPDSQRPGCPRGCPGPQFSGPRKRPNARAPIRPHPAALPQGPPVLTGHGEALRGGPARPAACRRRTPSGRRLTQPRRAVTSPRCRKATPGPISGPGRGRRLAPFPFLPAHADDAGRAPIGRRGGHAVRPPDPRPYRAAPPRGRRTRGLTGQRFPDAAGPAALPGSASLRPPPPPSPCSAVPASMCGPMCDPRAGLPAARPTRSLRVRIPLRLLLQRVRRERLPNPRQSRRRLRGESRRGPPGLWGRMGWAMPRASSVWTSVTANRTVLGRWRS